MPPGNVWSSLFLCENPAHCQFSEFHPWAVVVIFTPGQPAIWFADKMTSAHQISIWIQLWMRASKLWSSGIGPSRLFFLKSSFLLSCKAHQFWALSVLTLKMSSGAFSSSSCHWHCYLDLLELVQSQQQNLTELRMTAVWFLDFSIIQMFLK